MNTRRNFMRGLSGLGAIVATGHAPAIVKSMIAARGTMFGGAQSPIPAEFRQVKYITVASGKVWFPTGIYNTDEWTLDTIARYGSINSKVMFGAWYSDSFWTGYGLNLNYGGCRAVHGNKYGGQIFPFSNVDNSIIRCVCTTNSCTITWNGVTYSALSTVGLNGEQIYLLGNGVTVSAGNGTGMGETTIQRGGEEVAHLYPCVRISDGTLVFYDSIAKVAIENTGTGTAEHVELDT